MAPNRRVAVVVLALLGGVLFLVATGRNSSRSAADLFGLSSGMHYSSLNADDSTLLLPAITQAFRAGKISPQTSLGLCAMTIGEARFLEEFIIYHAALGFNQFYIYDQGTDQETAEVLAPYIASGLVTFTRVSNQSREHMFQALLLRKCFDDFGPRSSWLAHFDIDEFVVIKPQPFDPNPFSLAWPQRTLLGDILEEPQFANSAGVMLSRHNYVNLDIQDIQQNLVVETHNHRRAVPREGIAHPDSVDSYRYTKAFAHTRHSGLSVSIVDSHSMSLRLPLSSQPDLPPAAELYHDFDGTHLVSTPQGSYQGKMNASYARVYLNHYMQRDKNDCWYKADRRVECCPASWRAKQGRAWCDSPSFWVQNKAWEAPGQGWIRDGLRFDASAGESFAGKVALDTLHYWREKGNIRAWIKDQEHWEEVKEVASQRTIILDEDLWDYYDLESRAGGRPYGPPPRKT